MKLYISKLLSTALPIVGVLCIFGFAFAGNISMGWILFVVLALISGIINTIFFRCPHCGKSRFSFLTNFFSAILTHLLFCCLFKG